MRTMGRGRFAIGEEVTTASARLGPENGWRSTAPCRGSSDASEARRSSRSHGRWHVRRAGRPASRSVTKADGHPGLPRRRRQPRAHTCRAEASPTTRSWRARRPRARKSAAAPRARQRRRSRPRPRARCRRTRVDRHADGACSKSGAGRPRHRPRRAGRQDARRVRVPRRGDQQRRGAHCDLARRGLVPPGAAAVVHTDSAVLDRRVLEGGWKAKADQQLVADREERLAARGLAPGLRPGHSGVPLNEARRRAGPRGGHEPLEEAPPRFPPAEPLAWEILADPA